ncbi:hypothetical protein ACIQF6_34470 [Kitasatospora sp. NPDC092948]|uniref:hypothetical protein n=1 Tax=Kitasatospora sp. NPDC092948 TaxID=3364088 RepID=UPI003802D3D1
MKHTTQIKVNRIAATGAALGAASLIGLVAAPTTGAATSPAGTTVQATKGCSLVVAEHAVPEATAFGDLVTSAVCL